MAETVSKKKLCDGDSGRTCTIYNNLTCFLLLTGYFQRIDDAGKDNPSGGGSQTTGGGGSQTGGGGNTDNTQQGGGGTTDSGSTEEGGDNVNFSPRIVKSERREPYGVRGIPRASRGRNHLQQSSKASSARVPGL